MGCSEMKTQKASRKAFMKQKPTDKDKTIATMLADPYVDEAIKNKFVKKSIEEIQSSWTDAEFEARSGLAGQIEHGVFVRSEELTRRYEIHHSSKNVTFFEAAEM
jgi:hypothetical protein